MIQKTITVFEGIALTANPESFINQGFRILMLVVGFESESIFDIRKADVSFPTGLLHEQPIFFGDNTSTDNIVLRIGKSVNSDTDGLDAVNIYKKEVVA